MPIVMRKVHGQDGGIQALEQHLRSVPQEYEGFLQCWKGCLWEESLQGHRREGTVLNCIKLALSTSSQTSRRRDGLSALKASIFHSLSNQQLLREEKKSLKT